VLVRILPLTALLFGFNQHLLAFVHTDYNFFVD